MKKVYMLRTHYPHWGAHTAFNALGRYVDRERFHLKTRAVPMGDDLFKVPLVRNKCRNIIKAQGASAYQLNDLGAELSAFFYVLFHGVDIIHLLDAEHSLLFLPRWFKKWRLLKSWPRIIAMFHQPPSVLETLVNMDVMKQVDCVLAVSPVQADYLAGFIPAERIKTILLGVDTDHFKPDHAPKEGGKFKCLAGGVWLRDYESLIDTARLLQDHKEIEFHVVAPRLDIPAGLDNIVLHRNIPDAALYRLYQTSHILFMPLKDATANTFLMEGAACGLPVLSTDLESIRVYFPGDEAILIRDNAPQDFAEALIGLSENYRQLGEMAESARRRMVELSWDKISKEYESLYEGGDA